MTTMLATIDLGQYALGALVGAIVGWFAVGTTGNSRQEVQLIKRQLRILERKLDATMKHLGVELPPPPPSGLSREVEELASSPDTKIAAIRQYRQENPGVGLSEAKTRIEAFYNGSL